MKIEPEILEKYCEGKMDASEKAEFEKSMQADPGIVNEVKNYFLARSAIEISSKIRLKKHLDEMGKSLDSDYSKTSLYRYLLAAAGICLLVGIGWVMFYNFRHQKTADDIFLSYYQRPDISEFAERSTAGDSSRLMWNTALNDFSNNEILKASEELRNLIKRRIAVPIPEAYLMLGLTYTELNDFEKAIGAFDHINDGSSLVFEKQYYKALCFIKMGKKKEGLELLGKIRHQHGHPYRKNAIRILRAMK